MISRKTTRAELAAIISRTLAALDDEPVLVGGAVVGIYSDGRYVSDNLDFVTWRSERHYRPLLEAVGFHKRGSWWVHPDTDFLVQFVNPPVMVGTKHVRTPARLDTREGQLAILSPLDCVLDRLAWHLDRGDAQTLAQAIDVARAHDVPIPEIEGWLEGESWPAARKQLALEVLRRQLAAPRPKR
jgi:hypothetical protein